MEPIHTSNHLAISYPNGFVPTPISLEPIYQIKLPNFDGPLDLLLFLIKKHDVDVLNIPIGLIADRYVQHLEILESLNIDVAAEFLALAAELLYIKSKMLIPQAPETDALEERLDPRHDLVKRLLEYQRFKEAGQILGMHHQLGRDIFVRTDVHVQRPNQADTDTLEEIPLFKLIKLFDAIVSKKTTTLPRHIVLDNLSVAERIHRIIERLNYEQSFSLFQILQEDYQHKKNEIIVVFLSLLELTKLRFINIVQREFESDIFVYKQNNTQDQDTLPGQFDEYGHTLNSK